MELVKLTLNRFRMFRNFTMALGPRINVVRGPAGAGKTSIFQVLAFMRRIIWGQPSPFFDGYTIDFKGLGSEEQPLLQMEAVFRDGGRYVAWESHWDTQGRFTVFEKIRAGPAPESMADWLVFENHHLRIDDGTHTVERNPKRFFIRNALLDCFRWPPCAAFTALQERFRAWVQQVIFLDALDPCRLEAVSADPLPAFGIGGAGFTGFLAGLPADRLRRIEARIRQFFPRLVRLRPKKLPGGFFTAEYREKKFVRQLHELGRGQRRLITLAAIPELPVDLFILEELESGIPPDLLPQVLGDLAQRPFQILASGYAPIEDPRSPGNHPSRWRRLRLCWVIPCRMRQKRVRNLRGSLPRSSCSSKVKTWPCLRPWPPSSKPA